MNDEALRPRAAPIVTTKMYLDAVKAFDSAVCEAVAVSQATANRFAAPHLGYATHIFTRLCAYSIALIRAVPRSRWVRSDSDLWDFGSIAGYCRAIFEGQLLLWYIIKAPVTDEEWSVRINVMHLHDCSRRIKILGDVLEPGAVAGFAGQQAELRERLTKNAWFSTLDAKLQKRLLSGEFLAITTRDEQLADVGWDRKQFYLLWHLLSQYAHVLPLSFYRIEPNGRGTGVDNDTDRGYIHLVLEMAVKVLVACTDRIVQEFPDAAGVRKGVDSRFSPGPHRNKPRRR